MAGGGRYNHAEGDLAELPASSDDGWADTEPFPLGPEDGDEGGVAFAPRRPGLVIDASAGYRAEAALPPPPSPSGPDRRSHRGLPALAWRPVVPALRWALPLAALLTVGLYAGLSNRPGTLASQSATVAPPVTQAVPGAVASSTTVVQLPATATPPLALAPAVVAAPVEAARALALEDLPPTAAGAPGPALRWSVGSDADSATESTMLAQLARVSAADRPKAVLANARVGVGAGAEFAIARYDALKARPANWHVVAPLNTEELYAVVRADSPWRSLDELRGRRINVGAAGSARALSGTTLYRQMFGTALPIASATGLGRATLRCRRCSMAWMSTRCGSSTGSPLRGWRTCRWRPGNACGCWAWGRIWRRAGARCRSTCRRAWHHR